MRSVLVFLLFALVGIVSASNDYPALKQELTANRKKWESQKIFAYDMEITRVCFCVPEFRGPFKVSVKNGKIVEISPKKFSDSVPTVIGVFDFIHKAIEEKADSIRVKYDAKLGYPVSVFVDFDFMLADEERGFELKVQNIQKAPINSIDIKPTGGNGFNKVVHLRNLVRWRRRGPRSYKYELTQGCFCPVQFVGPFVVTVKNRRVEDVKYSDGSLGDVPANIAKEIPSIYGLFKLIENEARTAAKVDVKYDPRFGYPTFAFIDRIKNAIDDEITYTAKLL